MGEGDAFGEALALGEDDVLGDSFALGEGEVLGEGDAFGDSLAFGEGEILGAVVADSGDAETLGEAVTADILLGAVGIGLGGDAGGENASQVQPL